MRSGTSFFDWTVFKKTVTRFWPLWAAYSVLWAIFLPLSGLMALRLDASSQDGGGYLQGFARGVAGQTNAALTLAVIFGALCAMAVLSHLYSPRSANLFGSLPVRREGLFLTHYLAGLAFTIVPNVVMFLLTLLVEAAGGCVTLQPLAFWLAVSCGECLFFYSMAIFCGMFTGHILALPAFYGIFNVLAAGVTTLFSALLRVFYYGYTGLPYGVTMAVEALTPAMTLYQVIGYWVYPDPANVSIEGAVFETNGLGAVAAYAGAGVALAVCAFLLYRVRRLESAGDVVSVKPMRPVFKYGVAFCAGMAFGSGTTSLLGGGEFTLMACVLFWGVAGYFVAQMLLDKSFRVLKKWKGAAAVAGAFIVLFLVVSLDLTGFETRVPDPDQVKTLHLAGLDRSLGDGADWVSVDTDDPETIRLVQILHRAAVEQRHNKGGRSWVSGVSEGISLELRYTLRGGSTLERRYNVWLDLAELEQEGSPAWAVQQLYQDRELYWRAYGFERLEERLAEGWRLESANLDAWNEETEDYTSVWYYGAAAQELLAAVEEDYWAGRIGVRTLGQPYQGDERWRRGDTIRFKAVQGDNMRTWVEIAVQSSATSTTAALDRLTGQAVADGNSYQYSVAADY